MNTPNTASVSGSPKLSEILDQIEERNSASFTSITDGGKAVRLCASPDVPKLVKALRKQQEFIYWTAGKAVSPTSVRILYEEVTAILENRAAVGEAPDLEEKEAGELTPTNDRRSTP